MNPGAMLIVDDTAENRLLLQAHLTAAGYGDVRTAASACDAFAELALDQAGCNTPSPWPVDLILLDIMMPDMDGIEACRRIKASASTCDIAVLMVTAVTDVEIIQEAFSAGATDYITKPVRRPELLARVRSALTLKQEMDRRKAHERELEKALKEVKTLRGLLPICSSCKNIRNDAGAWQSMELYIQEHSDAQFSHGICSVCVQRLYPDVYALTPELYKD